MQVSPAAPEFGEPVKLKMPPGLGEDLGGAGTLAAEAANAALRFRTDSSDLPWTNPLSTLALPVDEPAQENPVLAIMREKEALAYANRVLQERVAYAEENAALAHQNTRLAEQNALLRAQSEYMWLSGAAAGDAWGVPPPPYTPDLSLYWQVQQLAQAQQRQLLQQQPFSAVSPSQRKLAKAKGGTGRSRMSTTCSFGSSLSAASPTASTSGSFTNSEDSDDKEENAKRNVPMTTVMMRNIPNNYSRQQLLDLINDQGFVGCYDLAYLPVDFKTEVGLGYAFINMVTAEDAERFRQHFHGFSSWSVHSSKVCEVSWSDVLQGVADNIERYRNSPVMHESVPDDFKPVLFRNGQRIPFPPPTKRIRAPLRPH